MTLCYTTTHGNGTNALRLKYVGSYPPFRAAKIYKPSAIVFLLKEFFPPAEMIVPLQYPAPLAAPQI